MKQLDIYLPKVAEKLSCEINFANLSIGTIIHQMINTQSEKGHFYCPCSVVVEGYPKVFCPCKEWVQKVKSAKKGDKCHCEVFVKS